MTYVVSSGVLNSTPTNQLVCITPNPHGSTDMDGFAVYHCRPASRTAGVARSIYTVQLMNRHRCSETRLNADLCTACVDCVRQCFVKTWASACAQLSPASVHCVVLLLHEYSCISPQPLLAGEVGLRCVVWLEAASTSVVELTSMETESGR